MLNIEDTINNSNSTFSFKASSEPNFKAYFCKKNRPILRSTSNKSWSGLKAEKKKAKSKLNKCFKVHKVYQ